MKWWKAQQSLERLEQLKEYIMEKEWQVPFTTKQQKILFKFFYARWKSAHSSLHSVAYILDLENWNSNLMLNEEVVHNFYQLTNTLFSNTVDWISCIKHLIAFR